MPSPDEIDEAGPTVPDDRSASRSVFEPDGRLRVGARVGRYRVERLLGEGGMGAVYQVHRADLDAHFAMKVMSRRIAAAAGAVERFVQEAKAVARVRHDHVVRVTDTGMVEGLPFLVMEYLEGRSFEECLEDGRMTTEAAIAIIMPVIAAVDAAHARGVIHRDLKPGNVFLADVPAGSSQVKVLDFGISKVVEDGGEGAGLTATGEFVGTPGYAAPEQLRNAREVGPAADQYAIGVMLYEATSGHFPFRGDSAFETIHKVLAGEYVPLSQVASVPVGFAETVERAMSLAPEDRFPSLHDLARGVLAFADGDTEARYRRVFGAPARSAAAASTKAPASPAPAPLPERASKGPRARVFALLGLSAIALVATIALFAMRDAPTDGATETPTAASTDAPSAVTPGPTGRLLRFGLSADVTHDRLTNDYVPLAHYLEATVGQPVELVTLPGYDHLGRGLSDDQVDLAWLPPYDYVRARDALPQMVLLARPIEGGDRRSYQGVIVTRAETGAPSDLAALRGKVFCYVNPTSSSGYLYPRLLIQQAGLDPDDLFSRTRFVGGHDRILPAVAEGQCDAGATHAGMLFHARERIDMSPDDFAIVAQTGAIPYGPYVARATLDGELLTALKRAFLAVAPGSDVAATVFDERSFLRGFEEAADTDYDVLRVVHQDATGAR